MVKKNLPINKKNRDFPSKFSIKLFKFPPIISLISKLLNYFKNYHNIKPINFRRVLDRIVEWLICERICLCEFNVRVDDRRSFRYTKLAMSIKFKRRHLKYFEIFCQDLKAMNFHELVLNLNW